jgi:hypothetical protein
MRTDLDNALAAWRERRPPADLSQLEPRVWAAIAAGRTPDAAGPLSIRAALVAAMMLAGIAAGATSSTAPAEASPFTLHSPFAPSTLLEGSP